MKQFETTLPLLFLTFPDLYGHITQVIMFVPSIMIISLITYLPLNLLT